MSSIPISIVRTFIPVVAGLLLTAAVKLGLDLDTETATSIATAVLTTGYYAVVRYLEVHVNGQFGWLLGVASAPRYPATVAGDTEI